MKDQKGFSIIEVVIAVALLGIIAAGFLSAMATASKVFFIADVRATAESLARSQAEYVKNQDYERYNPSAPPLYTKYTKDGEVSSSHPGYFIWVDVFPIDPDTGTLLVNADTGEFLTDPDTGQPYYDEDLQKIIVTIKHGSKAESASGVLTLEDYKVDR